MPSVALEINVPSLCEIWKQLPMSVQRQECNSGMLYTRFYAKYMEMIDTAFSWARGSKGIPALTVYDFRHASFGGEDSEDQSKGQWILEMRLVDTGRPYHSSNIAYLGKNAPDLLFSCGIVIENGEVTAHT